MPLVNPNIPNVVGKKLEISKRIDKNNKLYMQNFLDTLKKQNDAFFEYTYKEPNTNKETTKLSYIFHYKPLDWYIGTGIHLRSLDHYLASQKKIFEENLQYIILRYLLISILLVIVSYIFIYFFIRYMTHKETKISQYENIIRHIKKKIDMSYFIFDIKTKKLLFANEGLKGECNIEVLDDFLQYVVNNDYENLKKFLKNRENFAQEQNIQFRLYLEGEVKYFDCYTNQITTNQNTANKVMFTLIDITPYKQNEIRYLNNQLLHMQNKIDEDFLEYIHMIAHQWRHPISYINGKLIDIYLDDFDKTSFIDDIEKTTELLSQTIDDCINIFSNENRATLIELHTVINDTLKIFQTKLLKVEVKLDFITYDRLIGSKSKLQQVLMIVIKNSLDAFKNRAIKTPKIKIKTKRRLDHLLIIIEDNGLGIQKQDIQKVFDIYYTTKEEKNKGLGLYMAKILIEKFYNGKIKIRNTKDGLKTSIYLPIHYIQRDYNG